MRGTVECAVVVRRAAGSTTRFPAMPRAMLTVASAAGGAAAVSFHPMTTHATTHVHVESVRALGLVLPPDTAARLMGMSTGALADITLPWTEMIGAAEAARLDDALYCAGTDAARLEALQSSLRRVLASGCERTQRARAETLQHLCWAVGRDGVQAAAALGLGERQLERRCRALLGMTPKQMHRITRWHGLLSARCVGSGYRMPKRPWRRATTTSRTSPGVSPAERCAAARDAAAGACRRRLVAAGDAATAGWQARSTQRLGA
ncbi:MAG: hypothetical protein R3E48_03090 [Burkholderiaceae bacterium]